MILRFILSIGGVDYSCDVPLRAPGAAPHKAFGVLRKDGDISGDHTLGVHVYWRSEGAASLGVRCVLSNAIVRANGTGFCGEIVYNSLRMLILKDDKTLDTSYAALQMVPVAGTTGGSVVDFVVPASGGHFFPARASFMRHLLLVPHGADVRAELTAAANRAFGERVSEAFGPDAFEFPPLDSASGAAFALRAAMAAQRLTLGLAVRVPNIGGSGEAPLLDMRVGVVGPFCPDDDPDGGAPAGYKINPTVGWQDCPGAAVLAEYGLMGSLSRDRLACYDMQGEPLSPRSWTNRDLAYWITLPNGESELKAFVVWDGARYVYKQFNAGQFPVGSCPYRGVLEGYRRRNTEHLIRGVDDAMLLAGRTSAFAMDYLSMAHRAYRHFEWSDRSDDKIHPDYPGQWVPPTLSGFVDGMPLHRGSPRMNRDFGWMLYLGAWAVWAGDDEAREWIDNALGGYLRGCDANGIPQRQYHVPYMPSGVRGTQHFHTALVHNGALLAARVLSSRATRRVLELVALWRESVLSNPTMPLQSRLDSPGSMGPPKWIFTERGGLDIAPLNAVDTSGGGFQEHVLAVLGRAVAYSPRPGAGFRFAEAGLPVSPAASTLLSKVNFIDSWVHDMGQDGLYAAAVRKLWS